MPEQVGNQKQAFVAIVYFWLIQQTLLYSCLCLLAIKYFGRGCFAAPRLLRPGATPPPLPPVTPLTAHTAVAWLLAWVLRAAMTSCSVLVLASHMLHIAC